MANARAFAVVGLLLVLAVTLFAALYFTRDDDSSAYPFAEFTATATVQGRADAVHSGDYSISVYSHLRRADDWTVEARVEYSEDGVQYRSVYQNNRVFHGVVEAGGFFNVSECDTLDQAAVLETGSESFVPRRMENEVQDGRVMDHDCDGCQKWRLELAGETFLMIEKDGIPQRLVARGRDIVVSSYQPGRHYTSDSLSEDDYKLCVAQDTGAGTAVDDFDNTTVADPDAATPSSVRDRLQRAAAPHSRFTIDSVDADTRDETLVRPDASFELEHDAPAPRETYKSWLDLSHEEELARKSPDELANPHRYLKDGREAKRGNMQTEAYCPSRWKGDGWCDAGCNNAANNYDNGDCCPGTCTGRRTYPCGIRGYDCKSGARSSGRQCLFLHGLGEEGPNVWQSSSPASSSITGVPAYWGDMKKELKGHCDTFIYGHFDTTNRGWDDATLQRSYYLKCLEVYNNGGAVFAHSMGNVILGGACADQNLCGCRWYGLQGPIRGSKAAAKEDQIMKVIGKRARTGSRSLAPSYQGMGWASSRKDAVSRAIGQKKLMKGAICGRSGWGSGGRPGVILAAVKTIVYGNWKCTGGRYWWGWCKGWSWVKADGVVGWDECAKYGYKSGSSWRTWYIGGSSFSTSRNSNWYNFEGNHQDGTGARGNHKGFYDWMRRAAAQS
eukprot:TRINITY_DN65862_c8_g7_i1.p1 TRINITY_DN65862_c8_g7~~TRINITY_DN65862_c8_g7_i1.p1  ORF type:complete len:670 (+),score=359.77 TRINITY_DN65862_c8_g7_i1:135-2144(+)